MVQMPSFVFAKADKSLVLLQSTGAYKAAARLASATPPPAHVLSRGIGWQVINYLIGSTYAKFSCQVNSEHLNELCYLFLSFKNDQGIGILLDGLFGTVTGSTVSV